MSLKSWNPSLKFWPWPKAASRSLPHLMWSGPSVVFCGCYIVCTQDIINRLYWIVLESKYLSIKMHFYSDFEQIVIFPGVTEYTACSLRFGLRFVCLLLFRSTLTLRRYDVVSPFYDLCCYVLVIACRHWHSLHIAYEAKWHAKFCWYFFSYFSHVAWYSAQLLEEKPSEWRYTTLLSLLIVYFVMV